MRQLKAFWHWNERAASIDSVIKLTKDVGGNAVVLKAGYQDPAYSANFYRRGDFPTSAAKVKAAGLVLMAEVYCVPGSWAAEADCLRWAAEEHGACAVVLNMEGPYEAERNGANVDNLLGRFGRLRLVWACTDFRGNRLALPYHQALARHVDGWMPMVYPKAFYPNTPWGDLQRAFDDTYWRWLTLRGELHPRASKLPILPAIQSYDGMDWEEMVGQVVLAWRWTRALEQEAHGTSIYAAHDCNVRAKWGVRDGWDIVDKAIGQASKEELEAKLRRAAEAAGAAARGAVLAELTV